MTLAKFKGMPRRTEAAAVSRIPSVSGMSISNVREMLLISMSKKRVMATRAYSVACRKEETIALPDS
jgi:hypothetical protein